ncbi:MAG: hypothetical protein KBS35_00585, partial [Mycoplasma sp.]|nr:hypothetical protein [Candidatus Hennigella equi]
MKKRKTKALINLLPTMAMSVLAIGSITITLSSCKNDDPEPPVPPQPTEQVTITFDAGEGWIEGSGPSVHTTTLTVNKDTTWPQIENTYEAYLDQYHPFRCWSLYEGGAEIPPSWAFSVDTHIYAVYWEHEHDYSIYGVDETKHKVYVECAICHDRRYLTDEELKDDQFKNKLLVKRKEGEKFTWELTSNSLQQEIEKPLRIDDKLVSTIYLMNGAYSIGGYISGGTVIANLYGVTTEEHEMLATINCCIGNPISMLGIELHINNAYMLGATENIGRAFYFGLQPDA